MKSKIYLLLLALALSIQLSCAQKAEDYQNSYNYKRAIELLHNNGDEKEILDCLQKEIAEHPKNGYAYRVMSAIYERSRRLGMALDAANKAIELLKKDKEWLASAYAKRAKIYTLMDEPGKALADWTLALKANPKDVNVLSDRAQYYYTMKQYELSDKDYDAIISLDPINTLGYMGKGRNALDTKNFEEAKKLFTYALKFDANYPSANSFRAEAYMGLKRYNEAADDLITALTSANDYAYSLIHSFEEPEVNILLTKLKIQQAKNSNDAQWPFYIGSIYQRLSKYPKAIENFKMAAKQDASDIFLYYISCCYESMGDMDLALDYIDQALALDSTYCDYVMQKADLLYEKGDVKASVRLYDKYIEHDPEYYGGYYRRGFIKDNAKDVDGAIEDYTTCIIQNPNYAYAYLGRADQYIKKGNKDLAMADYRQVIAIDTLYGDSNCAQYAYLGLGEREKATAFMDSILVHSSSMGNYYDAACLYARMGERDSSLSYLRKSLEMGFRRFFHIEKDDDLDILHDMEEYKLLMDEYKEKAKREWQSQQEDTDSNANKEERICEVPFTKESGVCLVKCKINNLPLHFVFDTGASDISISMVEATFMMKNGYLTDRDVVGKRHYVDANGNVSEGTLLNLRNVHFGDLDLDNVKASVVSNQKAPLLLGQSVLSRLGKIEIDNEKRVLRIKYRK